MSLDAVLSRGLDGLLASQRALSVASNNISNINTKGYARQDVTLATRPSTGVAGTSGGGVEIAGVRSIVEPFVEMQLFQIGNSFGTVDGRKKTLGQLEALWNESQNNGLGKSMNEFFNTFSQLANQPTSIPLRQAVRDRGIQLAEGFNRLSTQMDTMKVGLSTEISARLDTINDLASDIATLNGQIVAGGGSDKLPELAAKRTYLLRQLSEELPINYYEQSNGSLEIQLTSGGNVVSGVESATFTVSSDDLSSGGDIAISMSVAGSSSTLDVTADISSGRLGGNLIDRNTTINSLMANLDTLAYQFATQFNTQYSSGYGLDSSTGHNFFVPLASATGAASLLAVDSSVTSDVRTIAAAQQDPVVSGVGDNRNALLLTNLQSSLTMTSGTATFSQYYQGLVGSIGNTAGSVNRDYDTQSYLMNQMEIQRESISGVNMDEEGANIIRYQRAFQAASKVISIANGLMDDLLRI